MICVAIFSGFTFLGAFASNPIEFGILRFLAGLGIGGVMPNVVALMTESAPKRISGAARGGYVQWLCYWRHDVSFIGCMVGNRLWLENHVLYRHHSILALPILWKFLPESLMFLTKKGETGKVREIVQKIAPEQAIQPETTFKLNEPVAGDDAPVKGHCSNKAVPFTAMMFWVAFFMCLLHGLCASWKLVTKTNDFKRVYSLGASMIFFICFKYWRYGGSNWRRCARRPFPLKTGLTTMFTVGAIALILLGFNSPQMVLYRFNCNCRCSNHWFSKFYCIPLLHSLYPTAVRLYRYGLGFGHWTESGAIVGPVLTGALLTFELPHQMNFLVIAMSGVIAALAVFYGQLKSICRW